MRLVKFSCSLLSVPQAAHISDSEQPVQTVPEMSNSPPLLHW